MGTIERRKRERRHRTAEIIRAAETVFAAKGYRDATMDEIARAAELSKGTLYLYFKGKDDVHRRIVAIGMQILYDLIQNRFAACHNAWDKLGAIWDGFMSFQAQHPNYCDAFIHYESQKSTHSSPAEIERWIDQRKVVRLMITTIKEGIADRSLNVHLDPMQTTLMLWAQIIGAIQLIRFKRTLIENLLPEGTDAFLNNFKQHILYSLRDAEFNEHQPIQEN